MREKGDDNTATLSRELRGVGYSSRGREDQRGGTENSPSKKSRAIQVTEKMGQWKVPDCRSDVSRVEGEGCLSEEVQRS